ncbi:hypothetical protein TERTU_4476 [Teredinibacter turnerae T7901]|uniref:Lipoprotein n=1 Tax=Teredinibacter turnerae (strain ATCC 39867 / T7901) TaxID=377629 RepID=C5BJ65_TERTT|nr:hypothetical protein [Teredinibacter turnerae]ACR10791.1 hypothetical protein TERTU_4476 [Teredinibacter turnerae T7901]
MKNILVIVLLAFSLPVKAETFQIGEIKWKFDVPKEYLEFPERRAGDNSTKYYKSEELLSFFRSNIDYLRVKISKYPISMESSFKSGWLSGESLVEGQFKRSSSVLDIKSSAKTKSKNGYKAREHFIELKLEGNTSIYYGSFQVLLEGWLLWLLEYQVVSPNKELFGSALNAWNLSIVE